MLNYFARNTRLLVLLIGLILVAGLSSYQVLPRMEDPLLTPRFAQVYTRLEGADAGQVEALVTEKLEDKLLEVEEIKEIRSFSRTGISSITIELRDDIYDVGPVWARIRDKLDDAVPELPDRASDPEFDEVDVKAYALIVSLTWVQDDQPNHTILERLAEDLEDELRAIPGTEDVDLFGNPAEEIRVLIDPEKMASLDLTAEEVANQIAQSDSKVSAGLMRGQKDTLLLEVAGELDSLKRIESIPIRISQKDQEVHFVHVSDIARVEKGIMDPPDSVALVHGRQAVALGVFVRGHYRVDHWTHQSKQVLDRFQEQLPRGVQLETVFEQNHYVENRLQTLLMNLFLGALAVVGVIFFLMGWRNALIVGMSLPLSALMVLTGMRFLGIPIHQMSVTGLIIALGLLIDNAIVMVDEVTGRLRSGLSPLDAVAKSVGHLAIPLLSSTLTTAFAFAPIALMAGPAGEFVGAIAISVMLAIFSSLFLALTVVPTITALASRISSAGEKSRWWREGFSSSRLTQWYKNSLTWIFTRPGWGLAVGLVLPVLGFWGGSQLTEQFFPPADRDQFHIEVELPPQAPIEHTQTIVKQMREKILSHQEVEEVHWFLGENAPSFYYNVIAKRKNTPNYAQALVQLKSKNGARELIHRLQAELDREFPNTRLLVRQLEQGPPFDAPIEVRLYGPDIKVSQALGEQVRLLLAEIPEVTHTRSDLSETLPKVYFEGNENELRMVGLDRKGLAKQIFSKMEGAWGGSVLEDIEELQVKTRVPQEKRATLDAIASTNLKPGVPVPPNRQQLSLVPFSAVAQTKKKPEISSILRQDGKRLNEVQAYIEAGVLPAVVLDQLKEKLAKSDFQLPPGYTLEFGGEAAERDTAVGHLMANVGILLVLMVATLVLSFRSFRVASLIGIVGLLSVGLGLGSLWLFDYPFGFMGIVGTMGLIGVAINDTIVVLANLREDTKARQGEVNSVVEVVVHSTRHIIGTTLTTMAGFLPLVLAGGGFWPPLAVAIAGGVSGATLLALYFIPSAYILVMCRGCKASLPEQKVEPSFSQEPMRNYQESLVPA